MKRGGEELAASEGGDLLADDAYNLPRLGHTLGCDPRAACLVVQLESGGLARHDQCENASV